MRGTASIASTVIRRCASSSTRLGLSAGAMRLTSVAPSASRPISSLEGALTLSTTSAAHASSRCTTEAPASSYASSVKLDAPPAPDSTTTSYPSSISWATVTGVAATRVSPGEVSLTTPIFMRQTLSGGTGWRPPREMRVSYAGRAARSHGMTCSDAAPPPSRPAAFPHFAWGPTQSACPTWMCRWGAASPWGPTQSARAGGHPKRRRDCSSWASTLAATPRSSVSTSFQIRRDMPNRCPHISSSRCFSETTTFDASSPSLYGR